MTIEYMRSIGGFEPETPSCIKCECNAATIAYGFPGSVDGYAYLCTVCTQELALGMLRDVVAVLHGEEVAQKQYEAMPRTYVRSSSEQN